MKSIKKVVKSLKNFFFKLVEGVFIKIIIALIFASSLIALFRKNLLSLYYKIVQTTLPLYLVILLIFIVICVIILIGYFLKRKNKEFPIARGYRYKHGDEQEHNFEHDGLKWTAYTPNILSRKPNEYVWLDGPFCPKCISELKWEYRILSYFPYWYCSTCNKKFKPIKKKEQDCREIVEQFCYAAYFRKKKFDS